MLKQARVGIIGGTGLGEVLAKEAGGEPVQMDTPFGPPSSPPIIADWQGVTIAFIARHGEGHTLNPSEVPYRANVMALKMLGVSSILASGAVGSLQDHIKPGQIAICDQVIDKTFRRPATFFGEGLVAHVEMADPFCPSLRKVLLAAAEDMDFKVHETATYVCMEGPQFSTRAESAMHRSWGGDLIGMTVMPEAKLAREAELCYALIALPTDYDCWRSGTAKLGGDALLAEILGNLRVASINAIALIRSAVKRLGSAPSECGCPNALKLALWSDTSSIDPQVRKRLEPLIGRYV